MGKWIYECQGERDSCETNKVALVSWYGFYSGKVMDVGRIG